jgi:4-diphosphocytidyl-2-C-methyl-D-erythritol kinase
MAIALNEIFALGLTKEQLAQEVRPLGADCPFFIYNSPCYAEGIGDKLAPIPLDLSGLRLIMIKPECGVSTKEAYGGIKPKGNSELFNMVQESNRLGVQELFRVAYNDFEDTVFEIHPEIATIKKRLQDAGAVYAAMSGSGSTVFGLFENDAEGSTDAQLRLLHEEFAAMVILDDTLA